LFSSSNPGSYEAWFSDGVGRIGVTKAWHELPLASSTVVGRIAGKRDAIVVHGSDGRVSITNLNRVSSERQTLPTPVPSDWDFVGVGDVDGAGRGDFLWRHTSGAVAWWIQGHDGSWTGAPILATIPSQWTPLSTVSDQTF
jgi:hypothetical protein